jgi:hypothetical protein
MLDALSAQVTIGASSYRKEVFAASLSITAAKSAQIQSYAISYLALRQW